MYEYRTTHFDEKDRDYRSRRASHESLDDVVSQMSRDGWRLVSTATMVYGYLPKLTLFWERQAK